MTMRFIDRVGLQASLGSIVKSNGRWLSLPLRRPPTPFLARFSERAALDAMLADLLGPGHDVWRPRSRGQLASDSVLKRLAERRAHAADLRAEGDA